MKKTCEVCLVEIPKDFGNALCSSCYEKQVAEIKLKEADEETDKKQNVVVVEPDKETKETIKGGVQDPNYKENPEAPDKDQWKANISQFDATGVLLWKPTKMMYEYIRDWCLSHVKKHPQFPKFIWRPTIVDVGCGSGIGSNILSNEADQVWGIDKNKKSVEFAKQAFTRIRNGIYYSSQVTFDQIDIIKDTRTFQRFDVVVAIEIIEHIDDCERFLSNIIHHFANKKRKSNEYDQENPTMFFLSTPNRNNKHIRNDKPKNPFHVRDWSSSELLDLLSQYFENIEFMSSAGVAIPQKEMRTTTHTPLLIRCWNPKV